MKTYVFNNKQIFDKIYESYFAMRIFHRIDEQNRLLIRFITKGTETELMKYQIIKEHLTELQDEK